MSAETPGQPLASRKPCTKSTTARPGPPARVGAGVGGGVSGRLVQRFGTTVVASSNRAGQGTSQPALPTSGAGLSAAWRDGQRHDQSRCGLACRGEQQPEPVRVPSPTDESCGLTDQRDHPHQQGSQRQRAGQGISRAFAATAKTTAGMGASSATSSRALRSPFRCWGSSRSWATVTWSSGADHWRREVPRHVHEGGTP